MVFQFNHFRNLAIFVPNTEQIESINSFFHLKCIDNFQSSSNPNKIIIIGTLNIAFCKLDEYLEKVNKPINTYIYIANLIFTWLMRFSSIWTNNYLLLLFIYEHLNILCDVCNQEWCSRKSSDEIWIFTSETCNPIRSLR